MDRGGRGGEEEEEVGSRFLLVRFKFAWVLGFPGSSVALLKPPWVVNVVGLWFSRGVYRLDREGLYCSPLFSVTGCRWDSWIHGCCA